MPVTFAVQERLPFPLGAYVDNLYYFQGAMPYRREKVFPSTTFDLKINLGDPVGALDSEDLFTQTACRDSWCMGIWSRHHVVMWPKETHFVGVTFRPGGAYAIFGIPLHEFRNQFISLDAIWGATAVGEIRERLHEAITPQHRMALTAEMLVARLRAKRPEWDLVRYALKRLGQNSGTLAIRGLCKEVGVSQRYLSILFKEIVGTAPKQLARLYRFKEMLGAINHSKGIDLTTIAHSGHFFDQSHFSKDFRSFTGDCPSSYMKRRLQVRAESPQHADHLRLLAIA